MADIELTVARSIEEARAALERFLDVTVDDDGALSFRHGDVPGAVQAVEIADGLVLLSLTCVVAWDLPDRAGPGSRARGAKAGPGLAERVALRAGQGLFGTLGVVPTPRGNDVILRYAFPATGLDTTALGTLLMLVVSAASQLRAELIAT